MHMFRPMPPFVHNRSVRRVGVLLVNLGTPSGTTYGHLRRYLKEFLSDPRVVEKNRLFWLTLLNGLLLQIIPFKSARNYKKIWDTARNESPLLGHTRAQAEGLQARLANDGVVVRFAMRYGQPAIADVMTDMVAAGVDKLVIVPLYPHYASVTTGSVMDAVGDALKRLRWVPTLRVVHPYFDHPAFIAALAGSVRDHLRTLGWTPDQILASYHGIPESYFKNGDPYPCHCWKTSRLLSEALGLGPAGVPSSFQSKFGRDPWVSPATEDVLADLPQKGTQKLAVLTPGFASDCVETLEEIAERGKEDFLHAGGEAFTYIPCLNASPRGLDLLETLTRAELTGWLSPKE